MEKTLNERHWGRFLGLISLAGLVPGGCASDLAQGYRSTPDYPAYANASCSGVILEQGLNIATERHLERAFGADIEGAGPSNSDWLSGFAMAFVFALAQERPLDAQDACAATAAAQASRDRRDGRHP